VADAGEGRLDEPSETGEIYLKLAALELDNAPSIVAFVNEYGPLGVRTDGFEALPTGHRPMRLDDEVIEKLRRRIAKAARKTGLDHERALGSDELPIVAETLDEFRLGARILRDLVGAWRVERMSVEPASIKWSVWAVRSTDDAASLLASAVSPALYPFRPTITLGSAPPPYPASLYTICALEIYNHIVEQAEYRTCKHCERFFVRQEGRAEYRQHRRSGELLYCSKRCADIFKQREYRRRQKAVAE
jgi:hypothetical protein